MVIVLGEDRGRRYLTGQKESRSHLGRRVALSRQGGPIPTEWPCHSSVALSLSLSLFPGPQRCPQPLPVPTDGFSSSRGSITEQELLELSEQLYGLDHNKARPGDIALNPQHLAGPDETGDKQDRSPQP